MLRIREFPPNTIAGEQDELDSFMFQTVGHEAIDHIAQAMGLVSP